MAMMSASLRKLNLTAHVSSSLGWMGAVAGFLVISIAGLTSQNVDTVRGAYLTMNLLGQYLIVPLSLAAIMTGLLQSVGTHWGLSRYYWVLVKFVLTTLATIILLLHQFTAVAGAARRVSESAAGTLPKIGGLGLQLVADAGLAVLVLLGITAISVYKPWGRTPWGLRQQLERRELALAGAGSPSPTETQASKSEPSQDIAPNQLTRPEGMSLGLKLLLVVIALLMAAFILRHLSGGGMHQHGLWMSQQLAGVL